MNQAGGTQSEIAQAIRFSQSAIRKEFPVITASVAIDLRRPGVLPPKGKVAKGYVRR